MIRKTSALLIASLTVAPSAQAIDWQINDDTTFSLYGSVEPKLINETDGDGEDSFELDDEDSTLGFYAEHRFANGLTAFGQLELEFDSDEDTGDGAFDAQDSAFAGIKGDFGKVQAGNFDSVYEDLIIDATEVAEDAEITDEAVASEDNMIAYYSPSFRGFSFRTQVRIQGENEIEDDGVNDADNEVGFAVAGGYTGETFGLYAGYDDRSAETVTAYDSNGQDIGTDTADGETYGAAGVATFEPIEVAVKYSVQDNEDNDPAGDDTEFLAGRGTFNYGSGDIYAAVQEVSPDAADDRTEVTVGADYMVFSNLKVWSEAGWFDKTNDEDDNFMVGAIYSF